MRRLLVLVFLLSTAVLAQNAPIVIRAGTLIDGTGHVSRNVSIVVDNGKITSVGSTSTPPNARVYDLSHYTVMPGWVDTHVHIGWHFGPDGRADTRSPGRRHATEPNHGECDECGEDQAETRGTTDAHRNPPPTTALGGRLETRTLRRTCPLRSPIREIAQPGGV